MRHLTERFFLKSVPESDFSFDHKSVGIKHNKNIKLILKSTKKKSCVRKFEKKKRKEEHKKKTQHTMTNLQIIGLENDTSAREIEGLLGGSVTH